MELSHVVRAHACAYACARSCAHAFPCLCVSACVRTCPVRVCPFVSVDVPPSDCTTCKGTATVSRPVAGSTIGC